MKFCSQCGQPLSKAIVAGRERPVCSACGHVVFRNPVPVAVVIAYQGAKILLVRRANDPLQGYWAPPTGYIELDETLEAGAVREVKEETGFDVEIERLVEVHSRPNTGIIFTVYLGHIVGGQARRDEAETIELGLFTPDELPQQDRPVNSPEIDEWFFEIVSGLLAQFANKER